MSDPDDLPDAFDKIFAQAEAVLDDPDARAARRQRILAAVAQEPLQATGKPSSTSRDWASGRGGWLAAASVAGLSLLVATQIYRPDQAHPPRAEPIRSASSEPPATTPTAPDTPAASPVLGTPAAQSPPRPSKSAPVQGEPTPAVGTDAAPVPQARAALTPSPALGRAEAPVPAAPQNTEELVVTGSRITAPAPATGLRPSPTKAAEKLRAAAAAGRVQAVTDLLERGVPVDAPDDHGETALMKAVQSRHPDVVALLRRQGADPDHPDHAGRSARDMAAAIADPKLDRALDPDR